jgi:hypothetical protein
MQEQTAAHLERILRSTLLAEEDVVAGDGPVDETTAEPGL